MNAPRIRKAAALHGRSLMLRDAGPADAAFVLKLRTDEHKARHLSQVSGGLARQQAWLQDYASQDGQAYFIIADSAGHDLGTVRLYDAVGDSFCWGSWILSDDAPGFAAIESALMVYTFAIHELGFRQAHFQVQKGNERVRQFHLRFGAQCVAEDETKHHFTLSNDAIETALLKYRRFLPDGIRVKE